MDVKRQKEMLDIASTMIDQAETLKNVVYDIKRGLKKENLNDDMELILFDIGRTFLRLFDKKEA